MELKQFKLKSTCFVLMIIALLYLPGCRQKTEPAPPTPEQIAAQKEFLAVPNVTTCELKTVKISKLDLSENARPSFIRRMEREDREKVKQGTITLDSRDYLVLLGDTPAQEFYIFDLEKDFAPYWWGSWSLHSTHVLNGKVYEFMLIDGGDKLAGRPYTGQFGTFKLGKGGREVETMEMNGSLIQAGDRSAPVGKVADSWPEPVTECLVPVGDYTPNIMNVTYDNLRVTISNNYYYNADGQRSHDNVVYGMSIRKDQSYVLDFSNEPMIIFENPRKENTVFSRGEEVKISAVLIDPKLDMMIRGLDDTSVKVDQEIKDEEGKVVNTYKRDKSLDPTVVISRSDGETVAEGDMPFG